MSLSGTLKADKSKTVQEFISLRTSDEITYFNYSILEYINGYDMFITNLLYDYSDEFADLAVTIEFSSTEKAKYRYKPYLLAYDIYGSTEAKFIVMMMNNIIDPKDFDFDKIKLISYANLSTLLNRIQAVNEDYLAKINSKLKYDFKENEGNTIWNE